MNISKNRHREKNCILGKMIFGENGYWGKWNFGRIKIWKNGISESSNLVKCKFGER